MTQVKETTPIPVDLIQAFTACPAFYATGFVTRGEVSDTGIPLVRIGVVDRDQVRTVIICQAESAFQFMKAISQVLDAMQKPSPGAMQ